MSGSRDSTNVASCNWKSTTPLSQARRNVICPKTGSSQINMNVCTYFQRVGWGIWLCCPPPHPILYAPREFCIHKNIQEISIGLDLYILFKNIFVCYLVWCHEVWWFQEPMRLNQTRNHLSSWRSQMLTSALPNKKLKKNILKMKNWGRKDSLVAYAIKTSFCIKVY